MPRFTLEGKRYDTGRMAEIWTGREEISTGVTRTGVWMTPRSKRIFVETHSIWDTGDGSIVGTRYHEAPIDEIAHLAEALDCSDLYDLVPDDSE